MNPDSTISAIRPSMIALVSTTMCGSPVAAAVRPSVVRPADEADRLGGDEQVASLGDGQPEHPEAQEERDAERQPGPERRGQARQREAEQQAHQQAEQQPDDGGHELGGRELLDPRGSARSPGRP